MATGMGTLSWVERTGGKLAWYDRLNLVFQGVMTQIGSRARRVSGKKYRYIDLEDVMPPDSDIAKESLQFCAEVSPPFLVNHSLRAYFWARLLDDQSAPFDDEVVFTALMLHDIGLTDTFMQTDDINYCFTLAGARKAQELGNKHNWSDKRTDLVANAITLYMNLVLSSKHGREAQMVKDGTGADVVGLRLETLYQDQVDGVINKYPRLNQNQDIVSILKVEAKARPCCRMAFFYKKLGMGRLIKNSQFSE